MPDLALLYGCNEAWWDQYWSPALAAYPAEKWTTNAAAAERYGLEWIAERNAPGLSADRTVVHHGHGSGYTLLNLVFLKGASRVVLLGYDLKYAPDYDGAARTVGSAPRHYFGEYPAPLQHWPSVRVKSGVHVELLELYRSVARQGLIEIINCSPDSALDSFPRMRIEDVPLEPSRRLA